MSGSGLQVTRRSLGPAPLRRASRLVSLVKGIGFVLKQPVSLLGAAREVESVKTDVRG